MLFYVVNLIMGAFAGLVFRTYIWTDASLIPCVIIFAFAWEATFCFLCRIKKFRNVYFIFQGVFAGLIAGYFLLNLIGNITHKYANYPMNYKAFVLIPYYFIWIVLLYAALRDGAYTMWGVGNKYTDLTKENIEWTAKQKAIDKMATKRKRKNTAKRMDNERGF